PGPGAVEARLPQQPSPNAADRVLARGRVGADMGAPASVRREGEIVEHALGIIRPIEIVIGAGIDHDGGAGAAATRLRYHLLARGGRGPVVGAADENERGYAGAPG